MGRTSTQFKILQLAINFSKYEKYKVFFKKITYSCFLFLFWLECLQFAPGVEERGQETPSFHEFAIKKNRSSLRWRSRMKFAFIPFMSLCRWPLEAAPINNYASAVMNFSREQKKNHAHLIN